MQFFGFVGQRVDLLIRKRPSQERRGSARMSATLTAAPDPSPEATGMLEVTRTRMGAARKRPVCGRRFR